MIKNTALKKAPVKILADSTCDIGRAEAEELDVTILPMSVLIDNKTYQQGVDITAAEFYEKLASSAAPPMTTQLTSYDLSIAYREATRGGAAVVAVHLSSALSGTYHSAVLAAREVPGVYTVDSQNATFGSALLVREAVKLRSAGKSAAEIAETVQALAGRVRLLAYVSTLKYLVRGGRLSAAAGLVGGMLNICPIITVKDGTVQNIGKARGKTAVRKEIARLAEKFGLDAQYDVLFGHSADADSLSALKESVSGFVKGRGAGDYEIGPVIGAHAGPGAAGMAFIAKD